MLVTKSNLLGKLLAEGNWVKSIFVLNVYSEIEWQKLNCSRGWWWQSMVYGVVNLRFGCVHRRVSVAHILRALEDAEGQRSQKVARCQQTSGWTQCEASVAAQKVVHLLQLWKLILDKDLLLFELVEDYVVLAASVFWHQVFDDAEHRRPSVVFGFGVVDVWDWIATIREGKMLFRIFIFKRR